MVRTFGSLNGIASIGDVALILFGKSVLRVQGSKSRRSSMLACCPWCAKADAAHEREASDSEKYCTNLHA